ncbi:MAG: helix-turn-helix domain-containing protein [Pseudomonadota bacterium]
MSPPLPVARLLAPRLSLASCVRACISRSTVGCAPLAEHERFNRYPASPLCSIAWVLHGDVLTDGEDPSPGALAMKGDAIFGGPQTRPRVTSNSGQVQFFFILLYPDAMHRLCGLDVSTCVDRFCPLAEVPGIDWAPLTAAVLAASDDAGRMAAIETFLEPRWTAVRGEASSVMDWLRRLGVQVAAAGWGRSARYIERRIRTWVGLPMRTLRRMDRAEQSFLAARADMLDGKITWAEVAADGGYADQSHLSREAREMTGLSPTELARKGKDDESYWIYRIWS